jgi:hypothetical protein
MSKHIETTVKSRGFRPGCDDPVEYEAECRVYPGDDGCHTMRNGDPGYPPTPAEVEIVSVVAEDGLPFEPAKDDIEHITEKALEQIARDEY